VKILVLGLNFAPEPIGTGKYTGELVAWLATRGHGIRVVTTPPYYPEWRVGTGYRAWWYRAERMGGAAVLRCPLWVPRRPSTLGRILLLASFALFSLPPCLWHGLRWRPDIVLTVEPTVVGAPAALLAARLTRARACLHVQDLELEAAFSLGLLSGGVLGPVLRTLYRWLAGRFDLVSTVSGRLLTRLHQLGLPAERLCLCPNWVNTQELRPLPSCCDRRRAFGLRDDRVIALYAGNMGEKQGVETLAEVARRLLDEPRIHFVLCGAGAARARLEAGTRGLPNVTLLPLQPRERLNELLNVADIHLLPQRPMVGDVAFPSKLGGMLASGRPVIAQAEGGEIARTVARCGIAVTPQDPERMAEAIRALARNPRRRRVLGRAARRYASAHLERDDILGWFEGRLRGLAAGLPPRIDGRHVFTRHAGPSPGRS